MHAGILQPHDVRTYTTGAPRRRLCEASFYDSVAKDAQTDAAAKLAIPHLRKFNHQAAGIHIPQFFSGEAL